MLHLGKTLEEERWKARQKQMEKALKFNRNQWTSGSLSKLL